MKDKGLSKSKYTKYCQCPKALWLQVYKPEEAVVDAALQTRFESGNEVGDLAMGLFGDFVEVTTKRGDGSLDLKAMMEKTRQCIADGVENIAEASFSCHGGYCAVDILRKNQDGWAIYEVKSTTWNPDKKLDEFKKYAPDIAYQKWVLTQCGINVTGTFLVVLDSTYVRGKDLDITQLFKVVDVAELVEPEYAKVAARVELALALINQSEEPNIDLGEHCMKPYQCAFWQYCLRQKHIPSPSVFDLYGSACKFNKKLAYYRQGQVDYESLQNVVDSDKLQTQIQCTLRQSEYIDKARIREFLDTLSYPLYFLDFETMQQVVPDYPGTSPYQQITFQYSLHYIEHEGGPLKHKEYLGVSGTDPRRELAEQLCRDIPLDVCTLAYNDPFEKGRIKELAADFPDLASHLLNIRDNIKDLLIPFRQWAYYTPVMGGSFSIKSVLPALFPDDPSLDYHNLSGVHNGGEAMTIFPRIKDMLPEQQAEARHNLLKYCELDTFAMVKVWEKLIEVS